MNYSTDETLKKPITRKPTGQKLASNNNDNQEVCHQKQTESENKELHQKLAFKEEEVDQLIDQNQKLSSELHSEKEKNRILTLQLDQFKESVDNKKLLAIGISIINNLAKPTDMSELNVIVEEPNVSEDSSEMV